jgi:hypothetical protein
VSAKPTVEELGIDADAQAWRRSGEGDGAIEVAFVGGGDPGPAAVPGESAGRGGPGRPAGPATPGERADWVLMRVAGDPAGRVLVFDRNEWECFLDGARGGEFDDAGHAPALVRPAEARCGAEPRRNVSPRSGNTVRMCPYWGSKQNPMGFHS